MTNKPKILLVDDQRLHREMYKDYLDKHGFETTTVSSADEAITKLTTIKYDLLITDIMMAGMNGWQLINHVREEMKIDELELPIIVISAYFDSSSKEWETFKHKGNAYLFVKSGSLSELLVQANRFVGRG